jgi:MFS family permease
VILAYAIVCYVGYTVSYWAAPYAERTFGFDKFELGWLIGAPAALGGFLGVIGGGWLADRLHRRHPAGRLMVMAIGLAAPIPIVWIGYSTADSTLFLICAFLVQMVTSSALGASAAASQALVLPRMRGIAAAIFLLGTTLIGLAFGPFTAGFVSEATGSLARGVIGNLSAIPLGLAALALAMRHYRAALAARASAVTSA